MRWRDWLGRPRPQSQRALNTTQVVDDDGGWRALTDPAGALPWHELRATLTRAAEVCRRNPLAARLVSMTTDFVVGQGATLSGPAWAQAFWTHPQNRLEARIYRWCDELTRAGELFLVLSRHPVDGMSYVREVSAERIDRIESDPDDAERELRYHQLTEEADGCWWLAPEHPHAANCAQVMLHYAINRPVGAQRGSSDLAQILTWLERYAFWLEDRVRINRFKGAYLWHVSVQDALPGQLEAKRAQYARPPRPGSIVITDGRETWSAVQPHIQADDVAADGRALRMMIAAGAGVPLHFLAEGEGANRATAREMGVATYRHFSHRQRQFALIVEDVVRCALRRAGQGDGAVQVAFEPVPEVA